jgi:lipoate-protein ligase B
VSPGHAWLGRVEYPQAVSEMEARRERILSGDEAAAQILLCEHPPVITMGRRAPREHVVASDAVLREVGVQIHATSRGGEATYHGPGQLVIYPIVRLRRGLVEFLETIAGAIADTARHFGVDGAAWRRDPAGVWLGGAKLAACGVHLRRRVAIHGFALNVSTPASMWQLLVPCGHPGGAMTSLAAILGDGCPSVEQVARVAGPILSERLADLT